MNFPWKKTPLGKLFEFGGFGIILCATIWQAGFSGWWEDTLREWNYYIQEEVNFAILSSVRDLSRQEFEGSPTKKKELSDEISKRLDEATFRMSKERDARLAADNSGQAHTFFLIRNCLLIIGAGMLFAGKGFEIFGNKRVTQ
jgi:hypothetical protein